jgi:xylulokinase
MKDLVIGVDCSTSAAKAVVFDPAGRSLAESRRAFPVRHPRSGWAEQDPADWWTATSEAVAEAAGRVEASRIAALSVTHQRESFVCLGEKGDPVRPAMLWLDIRATAEVDRYGTEAVHAATGKPPNPTPAWYKLLWLAAHEPETLARTAKVVDVGGYLLHRLTGRWVTSWASADPLGLVHLSSFTYDRGLLAAVGLEEDRVPALLAPGAVAGALTGEAAARLGLPAGLPVVAGAGDGQSAGLGCNVTAPGRAYLNLGTGVVSGTYAERFSHAKAYRTMGGAIPGTYVLETFIGGGTHNVSWFVEHLAGLHPEEMGLGLSAEQILEAAAELLPPGAEGLLCLPYWTGALTPYWDGHARGALLGLSGIHGKAHIHRAILEGLSLEQRLLSDGAAAATGEPIDEFVVLGGGSRSRLWCQILADVLGRPVRLARERESTALGVGMLAAAAVGIHPDVRTAAAAMSERRGTFEPRPEAGRIYGHLFDTYRGIYPALRSTFGSLAEVIQP